MDTVLESNSLSPGPGPGTGRFFSQEPTGDDNSGSGGAIKRGMLPFGDLVCLRPKMSETSRRSQRLATDFSIARILAADEPCSSSSTSSYASGFSDQNPVPKSSQILSCPCCPDPVAVSSTERKSLDRLRGDREETISGSERIEESLDARCPVFETSDNSRVPVSRDGVNGGGDLPWLHCTRYRPPRLPKRSSTGKVSKRRPGKHPRIPFTPFQLQILEDKYSKGAYLARRDVVQLSLILRLPQSRVKIWFQNRRARERRESLQSLNDNKKSEKDIVIVDNA